MKLQSVLLVGGAGFIGRHVAAALARRGLRVVIPTRRPDRAKYLLPLPTVDVVRADVLGAGVLERLARGCQAVVNLAGVLHSRRGRRDERGPNDYGPDFARVHVELPRKLVDACRKTRVRRQPPAIGEHTRVLRPPISSGSPGSFACLPVGDRKSVV